MSSATASSVTAAKPSSMTKWLAIVRFELFYQLHRRSTWVFFALFLLMLFGETNGQVLEALERKILFFAPLFIAESGLPMGLLALLVMAAITGDAATRDVETRLEPLMHATPIGRAVYLGGRFAGAFIGSALLLLTVPIALILGGLLHSGLTPQLAGPFPPAAFLQLYFLLILPNAFVATVLMFSLAVRMRHAVGSYVGAALMFAATVLTTQLLAKGEGQWELAALLNPAAHTSIAMMKQTWPPADLNARTIWPDGGLHTGLLGNRLLWLGVSCALLAVTIARFRYGANSSSTRWWQRGRTARARLHDVAAHDGAATVRSAPHVPRTFGTRGRVRQTLAVMRDSIREMTTRWSWLVVPYMAVHALIAAGEVGVRGTPVFATTDRVLASFYDMPPPFIISIFVFIIIAAGELIWRERDANIHALSDTAPMPNRVRFAGKLLGLWFVIVALHALLLIADVILQTRLGSHELDLALYVQVLFGLQLLGPLLFAAFALSVHILVNQKHVGHVAVLAGVAAGNVIAQTFGIEHPLLLPFASPGWRYSPISGFAPYLSPFLWLMLYWAVWLLLLALVAGLFWVRGVHSGLRERIALAQRRVRGRAAIAFAPVAGVLLLVAGFIFYNTNVLNDYHGSAEGPRRQAEYERRYARHAGAPQPQLVASKLNVELYPERRQADIRGVYTLVNRTQRTIDTVHVALPFPPSSIIITRAIELDRPARAVVRDDALGHRTYALTRPLEPGQTMQMSWHVRYEPHGFPARLSRVVSNAVLENGTFIQMHEWIPGIGYQRGRELRGAADRKEHALPARPELPSLHDLQARSDGAQGLVHVDTTVGTAARQTAVAPGVLRSARMHNGRRYFHYTTDAPIGPGYAIFSAEYAVAKVHSGGVTIEVFHHPSHTRNLARMLRSASSSLAQYTKRFGPYPYKVLRFVEYTRKDGGAHAADGNVWFSEVFPLLDPARDRRRFDLPFAVIAHETAHQFQVVPARVEGIALLSESFAWYAALGVIEAEYGAEHLSRFLGFMRRDYLDPRARADVPLLRAADRFLGYRKGPFAMYALREYVGQEKVDLAWRRLIARHASHQPPFATSLDLLRELQAVTPPSHRSLLGDLLERNTFWELKTTAARAEPAPGGQWRVSVDVVARKVAVDTEGKETDIPMNDLIEIGAFAAATGEESRGKPLHMAMHRIRTGAQTITLAVAQKPARAGIDPRHLLIDVQTDDNLAAVACKGAHCG